MIITPPDDQKSIRSLKFLILELIKSEDQISLESIMILQRLFNFSLEQQDFDLKAFYTKILSLRSPENLSSYNIDSLFSSAIYLNSHDQMSFKRILMETFQEILFHRGNELSCRDKFLCYLADNLLSEDESRIAKLLEKHIEMEIAFESDLEVTQILKAYIKVSDELKSKFAERSQLFIQISDSNYHFLKSFLFSKSMFTT